jgi:hypothetical protein
VGGVGCVGGAEGIAWMRVGGLIFFAESVEASSPPSMVRAIRFGGVIR